MQRVQALAPSKAQPADPDVVDLTSDEPPPRNPAAAVVPPRQLPPYMMQRENGVPKNAAAAPRPSSATAQALAAMKLAAIDHNNRMFPAASRPAPAAHNSNKLVPPYSALSARRDIDYEGEACRGRAFRSAVSFWKACHPAVRCPFGHWSLTTLCAPQETLS